MDYPSNKASTLRLHHLPVRPPPRDQAFSRVFGHHFTFKPQHVVVFFLPVLTEVLWVLSHLPCSRHPCVHPSSTCLPAHLLCGVHVSALGDLPDSRYLASRSLQWGSEGLAPMPWEAEASRQRATQGLSFRNCIEGHVRVARWSSRPVWVEPEPVGFRCPTCEPA
jgi:hypothetical protein